MQGEAHETNVLHHMAKALADLQQQLQVLRDASNDDGTREFTLDTGPRNASPCFREERLQDVIKEAIEELEESRKSFKSKRLEKLRKKLIRALIENPM